MYQSLGFPPEFPLERWQGAGRLSTPTASKWSADNDLRLSLHKLDERAFYVPRVELLNSLLEDCCVEPALHRGHSKQKLQGYGLARSGALATYIGPVVAVKRSVSMILLDCLLQRLAGTVFLDVRITADIADSLTERGFAKQRVLTRMSLAARGASLGT